MKLTKDSFKTIDIKIGISFGALVLTLMLVVFVSSGYLFGNMSKLEKRDLAIALAQDISNSIALVNYGGIYQTRHYIEKTASKNDKILSIKFIELSGKIVASSNPIDNGKLLSIGREIDLVGKKNGGFLYEDRDDGVLYLFGLIHSGYLEESVFLVTLEMDISSHKEHLIDTMLKMTILILSLLLFSLFAITQISRYFGKPIKKVALELQAKTLELEKINRDLELRVKKEVDKAKKKDEIIYEQNRKNALGELLLNIAHQWRQPLNVVALNLHLLVDMAESSSDVEIDKFMEKAETIEGELQHLSSIITKFSNYYTQSFTKDSVKLEQSLDIALDFLKDSIEKGGITVIKEFPSDFTIYGNKGDFAEMFIGLLNNVCEISSDRNLKMSEVKISAYKSDGVVIIEVQDNAGGIEEEILPKIFDPYTTTRFKSKNRGLGLYMIQNSIVYRYNGQISAKNCDGGAKIIVEIENGELNQTKSYQSAQNSVELA